MPRHRSSAVPLTWLYAGLIVYASLYPFSGWRVPGHPPLAFLAAPWWHWWTAFDLVSNLLGYMPLGALMFGALVRTGSGAPRAALLTTLAGTALSLSMETLQNFLPQRVASNVDLALNALGTTCGAALGALVHRYGWVDRWQATRDLWFIPRSAGGLALLLLWPIGLLFPTSVPFGLGQVLGRLRDLLVALLQDTAGQPWVEGWTGTGPPSLGAAGELALVVLGLLAPCLVAFTIARPGWRRVVFALGAAALGCAATTLSIALNFGPDHALAWVTPQVMVALAVGTGAAALLSLAPRRVAAGFGLMALTALVMLVARAPADPYYAQSLQAWEQGRFIRFHGAAQWVGWAWPYAALTYLLVRVAAREQG
ncbi:MAG TPA: VanZ family protein [Caldimonas sp.]